MKTIIEGESMKIIIEITSQQIADLMVTVIEGNSMVRSWCEGIYLINPTEEESDLIEPIDSVWYSKAKIYERPFALKLNEIIDETKAITQENIKQHIITSVSFAEGFALMAKQYPDHFADFIMGNYDIITADVFIQCVALGDVVYG